MGSQLVEPDRLAVPVLIVVEQGADSVGRSDLVEGGAVPEIGECGRRP